MSAAYAGSLVGALIVMLLISRLIRRFGFKSAADSTRLVAPNVIAAVFGSVLGGFGYADGGSPDFVASFALYVSAALLVLGLDAVTGSYKQAAPTKDDDADGRLPRAAMPSKRIVAGIGSTVLFGVVYALSYVGAKTAVTSVIQGYDDEQWEVMSQGILDVGGDREVVALFYEPLSVSEMVEAGRKAVTYHTTTEEYIEVAAVRANTYRGAEGAFCGKTPGEYDTQDQNQIDMISTSLYRILGRALARMADANPFLPSSVPEPTDDEMVRFIEAVDEAGMTAVGDFLVDSVWPETAAAQCEVMADYWTFVAHISPDEIGPAPTVAISKWVEHLTLSGG